MGDPTFFQELQDRGLIYQCSDPAALCQLLQPGRQTTFYLGIDPTAPSLHCGHLLPVLLALRLADQGHRAILLLGSATARIGDPSGKTEMRKLIEGKEIDRNVIQLRKQLEFLFRGVESSPRRPVFSILENKDWLNELRYIDFLRDIGRHFSVNRMLSFESCKQRLEWGLSFLEFNYQLLQSYDYLHLYQRENCLLQIGGSDQWGNMVAGTDLIRRYNFTGTPDPEDDLKLADGKDPQVLTVPLITTSEGRKMGKTEQGAVFLDPEWTSPFDFFQYWRNVTDEDVKRFLLLFTFLPVENIEELCRETGKALNRAKEVLAFELLKTVHGPETAEKTLAAARARYGTATAEPAELPGLPLPERELEGSLTAVDLFVRAKLANSRNEARRLIQQGGASINGQKIQDPEMKIGKAEAVENALILKAGKKRFFRFEIIPSK